MGINVSHGRRTGVTGPYERLRNGNILKLRFSKYEEAQVMQRK